MQTIFLSSVEWGGEGVQNYANNIFKFFKTGTHFFRPNFLTKSWIGPKSTKKFFFRKLSHSKVSKTSKCDLLHFFFWINFFNIFNHRKKNLFDKKITFNVMHQRLYFLSKMHQLKHMVVVLFLYDINFVQKILFHWWCPICVSLKNILLMETMASTIWSSLLRSDGHLREVTVTWEVTSRW